MTKDEALKLALEALQNPWKAGPDGVADAITAIKEALAQPEPEYLAFMDIPQRTWVGLTDEDIRSQWSGFWVAECHPWAIEFARAIEAKLKEKNT